MAGSAILAALPIWCVSGFMHLLKCIAFYVSFLSFLITMRKGTAGNYFLCIADMHHV
jgi:hypothetical protein